MRRFLGFVSAAVAFIVVVCLMPSGLAVAGPGAGGLPAEPVGGVRAPVVDSDGLVSLGTVSRPDWVSASVSARVSGQPVEVLSERSESRRVFVYPDSRVQVEQAAGPVQFRVADGAGGGWRRVDTRLEVKSDGWVGPVGVPGRVRLAGGGSGVAGAVAVESVGADGAGVKLGLPGVVLPRPALEGSAAVYRDVFAGVDVRVEVRPAGFELLWVVKSPAAAKALVAKYGTASGEVVLPTSLTASGVAVSGEKAGGGEALVVRDVKGRAVGRWGAPLVWDASGGVAEPGRGAVKAAWRLGVRGKGVDPLGRRVEAGDASVVVPGSWLTDPKRVFPVSVDPTYASGAGVVPVFDTFVQQGYSTDQSGAAELKLGNNGQGQVARSFLTFETAPFKGKSIVSASLSLMETWSYSCSPRAWVAQDAGVASTASRWSSQPSLGSRKTVSSETLGFSSACQWGRVHIDVTSHAQAWSAAGSAATQGLMLAAADESDPYGWKRFMSAQGQYVPVIGYTYDRAPGVPGAPAVSGSSYRGTVWSSTSPTLSVTAPSDADVDAVRVEFARFLSAGTLSPVQTLCSTGVVAGGTRSSCASAGLADNQQVWVRARAFDGRLWSGWSQATAVTVAAGVPNTPGLSCSQANGSWQDAVVNQTCTITATGSTTSAPLWVQYSLDGVVGEAPVTQPTSGSPQSVSFTVKARPGAHKVQAWAVSPLGKVSSKASWSFGQGGVAFDRSLLVPVTTTDTVAVKVSGPPKGAAGAVTGRVQWRVAGSAGNAGWTDVSPAIAPDAEMSSAVTLAGVVDVGALAEQQTRDGAGFVVSKRVSTTVEVRACLTYDAVERCTVAPMTVIRVPHAYGQGFPTTQAGPANVALWTGEVQVSSTDASVQAPGAPLTVSRTWSSFAGPVSSAVFGPGWQSSLSGDEQGVSGSELVDSTRVDGTLVLVDDDGSTLAWKSPGGPTRRASADLVAGVWVPWGQDAADAALTLEVKGVGALTEVWVTDSAGVRTRFTARVAPSTTTDAEFMAVSVLDKVTGTSTSFVRDTQGRVTGVVAPNGDGVTVDCGAATTPVVGCRRLQIAYASANTATATTPGDRMGQITTIAAWSGAASQTMTKYSYDTVGRLVKVTDQVTGLATSYSYDTAGRLLTTTPAGSTKPFRFTYTNSGGRIDKVERDQPAPLTGTMQIGAFRELPGLAGVPGLVEAVGRFDDANLPRSADRGFAVFGADKPLAAGASPAAGSSDWHLADVQLTDGEGYTIHEGSFGGGRWQLGANIYDDHDNVIRAWDARTIAAFSTGEVAGDLNTLATETVFNDDTVGPFKPGTTTPIAPAGTLTLATISPVKSAVDATGEPVQQRVRTRNIYNEAAPSPDNSLTGQPFALVTTTLVEAITADASDLLAASPVTELQRTRTSYGTTQAQWQEGLALSVARGIGAQLITRETRYDSQGRVVEQWQPSANASSATDAAKRVTSYYTATTGGVCGGKPDWAGLVCQVGPKGGAILPTTTTTYNQWLQPVTSTTVSAGGAVSATTVTSYDAQWRPVTVQTTTTGLASSTPVPAVTTAYDSSTGLVASTSSSAGTIATTYDQWGRALTYSHTPTGGTADQATTVWDSQGRVSQVSETSNGQAISTKTFTYDGIDANGAIENRGLLTGVSYAAAGQTWASRAAYDAQGSLTRESLPGGITRNTVIDSSGETTGYHWTGPVTVDGKVTADQSWLGWSISSDLLGRTVGENSVDGGAAYIASPAVPKLDKRFGYDPFGRLVSAATTVNSNVGGPACTSRQYWLMSTEIAPGKPLKRPALPA